VTIAYRIPRLAFRTDSTPFSTLAHVFIHEGGATGLSARYDLILYNLVSWGVRTSAVFGGGDGSFTHD
jgi:hypothetical protein